MDNRLLEYLVSIRMPNPIISRVQEIYQYYAILIPNFEATDIFVSDYIDDDGNREYENLWFFNDDQMFEARSFVGATDLDSTPFDNVKYVRFESSDFNYIEYSTSSRLNFHFEMPYHISGDISSSQDNCLHLMKIFQKYFEKRIQS